MNDAGPIPDRAARLVRRSAIAKTLDGLADDDLATMLAQARMLGSGIGGSHQVIEIDDTAVFVKQVPVTAIEQEPINYRSTRNLFGMPMGSQYGVGSPGFGVWREVAANIKATDLVLSGGVESFAAMYHWRVVDRAASVEPLLGNLADVDEFVAYWHDSPGIRRRAGSIASATQHVALFLEHIPVTLPEWLVAQVESGDAATNAAVDFVERCLLRDVAAMNSAGLFHFDAHFNNLLTDGQRIYFADFGLATSPDFDLSVTEREFLDRNASHDLCHTITRLVDWLVTRFVEPESVDARNKFITSLTPATHAPAGMNQSAWRVITQYAPIAAVINDFYTELHTTDRTTLYPAEAVLQACDKVGMHVPIVV